MEKTIGRPKGVTNLSEQTKLGILQQKRLQIVTQQRIANDYGVSRKTVNQMTADDLKPETKLELLSFEQQLAKARDKVIQRINEKLDNNDFKDGVYPNLLNAVNTHYRLETNQSTANIAVLDVAKMLNNSLQQARDLHLANPDKYPLPTKQEILESYEATCQKNGISPDYDAIDLSVLDGNLDHNQGQS
jgi:hypothetical protein